MKACTLPMLRAAFAMSLAPIPFKGKSFRKSIAGHELTIGLRVVEGLVSRKLAKISRRFPSKNLPRWRSRPATITAASLTAAGRALVRANPPLCIGCGCTDAQACAGGCSWVVPGWCSACEESAEDGDQSAVNRSHPASGQNCKRRKALT